jgi:hypothetical protein
VPSFWGEPVAAGAAQGVWCAPPSPVGRHHNVVQNREQFASGWAN